MSKSAKNQTFSFFFSLLILFLTSCEGFFNDNNLESKIKAAIDYANAPFSTFVVNADTNSGTIIPSGQVQYKPTDLQNIEFTMNPSYEFIEWEFSYKMISQSEDSPTLTVTDKDWWKDYIKIVKQTKSEPDKDGKIVFSLQIKFLKAAENLLITPKCGKKPMVKKMLPETVTSGVSRDTEVSITFDSQIDPSTIDGSIKIKVNGADYTDFFTKPIIASASGESETRIVFSPIDKLPCENDSTSVVTIELSDAIKTIEGISFTSKTLSYIINSSSSIKAFVNLAGYVSEQGTPNPNSSQYSFDTNTQIPISFKENTGWQFLHWETNTDDIKFKDDDYSLNPTTFYTLREIKQNENANIIPFCIERPVFNQTKFNSDYAGVKPRDVDITLYFNNIPDGKVLIIPDDAEFGINCSGKGDVSLSFENAEVINGNIIQITAKESSRIQVTDQSTITVTIPSSIYYEYHDEATNKDVRVTLGTQSNGKLFTTSYEIDSKTKDSATVTIRAKDNDTKTGTLVVDGFTKESGEHNENYYIDTDVNIKFTPSDAYEFLYWKVEPENSSAVIIKDKFSAQTSLTVKTKNSVVISAKCAPKINVTLVSPVSQSQNPCDSDIVLETNVVPKAFSNNGNNTGAISITFNGTDITTENYNPPVIQSIGNNKARITLSSKKKLPVPVGSQKNVVVKIDGTFYYEYPDEVFTTPVPVYIKNGSFTDSFTVTADTKTKVYVKFEQDNVNINTAIFHNYEDDDFNENGLYAFNEDSEFELPFTMKQDYIFNEWKVKNKNGSVVSLNQTPISITSTEAYGQTYYSLNINKLQQSHTVGTKISPITIYADSLFLTKITSISPENTSTGVPCDTPLVIKFNKKMEFSSLSKGINCDIEVFDQYLNDISFYYSDPVVTLENGKTVVTMNIKPDYSIKDVFGYNNTALIQVFFNAGFCGDDEIPLDVSEYTTSQEYINLIYKINTQTEDSKPSFTSYSVYSTTRNNKYIPYTNQTPFDIKNRVAKILYYEFSLNDVGSGIDGKMDIHAQKIFDVSGTPVTGTVLKKTVTFTGTTVAGNLNFSNDFENGAIEEDCMIKLDFVIYDIAGNNQVQTYYVAMDKNLDIDKSFIYNRYFDSSYNLSTTSGLNSIKSFASTRTGEFDMQNNNGTLSWINSDSAQENNWNFYHLIENKTETYIYFRYPKLNFITFNGNTYADSLNEVKLYYGTNYSTVNTQTSASQTGTYFEKGDFHYYVFKITASKTDHTYVKLCVVNNNGDTCSRTAVIPRSPKYTYYQSSSYTNLIFESGLNDIKVEASHLKNGVDSDYKGDSSYTIVRSNLTKQQNDYIGSSNTSSHDKIINLDLTNGKADFLFTSRYWIGQRTSTYKFSALNVDLRSPASNKFSYNSSNTNTLPSISGLDNMTFISGGPSSGVVKVKTKISNYSTFTTGTYAGTKILYTSQQLGNKIYDISSDGYITVDLTYSSDRVYLIPVKEGYKSPYDYFPIDRTYNNTGIYNMKPVIEYEDAKYLIDGAAVVGSFVSYCYNLTEEEIDGETYITYEYIFVPKNLNFDESEFDSYNPITGYTKKFIPEDGIAFDGEEYYSFIRYPVIHGYDTYVRQTDLGGNYYIGKFKFGSTDPEPIVANNLPPLIVQKDQNQSNVYNLYSCNYSEYFITDADLEKERNTPGSLDKMSRILVFNIETYDPAAEVWNYDYNEGYSNGFYRDTSYVSWPDNYHLPYANCKVGSGYEEGDPVIKQATLEPNTYYRVRVETKKLKSLPVYYYSSPVICSYKKLTADNNNATITCDQPAVYYCCYSFDNYGNDMDKWEVYAAHTKTGYTSFPTRIDTSEVPSGMYYVIMAHFADNTTTMSNVFTK